jgi:pimeloyl-ACP methyl ester carboxylesterase
VHDGHELVFEVHGEGPRALVFLHGLLLGSGMNRAIARRLAAEGNRVVLLELLGHGRSERTPYAFDHRIEFYAEQVVGLLDHLELDEAVIGGTSLGANVALQVATDFPDRVRALVVEMPVLERGGVTATLLFVPLLLVLRYGTRAARLVTTLVRRLPRTGHDAIDAFLELASADPRAMAAVLHGLASGQIAPSRRDRQRIEVPALVIGHPADLLHPIDDASALVQELPNAELIRAWSVAELRTFPGRLVPDITSFLDGAWAPYLTAQVDEA